MNEFRAAASTHSPPRSHLLAVLHLLLHVKSLEIHPCDDELPPLAALRGLAPGSTGDLSAVDFVRSLRHD